MSNEKHYPVSKQREHFEKWAQAEAFNLTANTHTGKYIYSDTQAAYAAYRARDPEIQRLLDALTGMVHTAPLTHEAEMAAHQAAVQLLAEYLPDTEVTHD